MQTSQHIETEFMKTDEAGVATQRQRQTDRWTAWPCTQEVSFDSNRRDRGD